jgi:hypothetical protein
MSRTEHWAFTTPASDDGGEFTATCYIDVDLFDGKDSVQMDEDYAIDLGLISDSRPKVEPGLVLPDIRVYPTSSAWVPYDRLRDYLLSQGGVLQALEDAQ